MARRKLRDSKAKAAAGETPVAAKPPPRIDALRTENDAMRVVLLLLQMQDAARQ